MKKAGDLLGAFFDERLIHAARGYSELFTAWRSLVGEKIAAHSRIAELDKSIIVVDADHPGWIQILQTKQASILENARRMFPQLAISGISFRLAKDGLISEGRVLDSKEAVASSIENVQEPEEAQAVESGGAERLTVKADPYAAIADDTFRELLMRLEKSIKTSNKTR